MRVSIHPAPSDEEAAAIAAAVEELWPRTPAIAQAQRAATMAWRLSGRWWHRDRLAHRDRPWW